MAFFRPAEEDFPNTDTDIDVSGGNDTSKRPALHSVSAQPTLLHASEQPTLEDIMTGASAIMDKRKRDCSTPFMDPYVPKHRKTYDLTRRRATTPSTHPPRQELNSAQNDRSVSPLSLAQLPTHEYEAQHRRELNFADLRSKILQVDNGFAPLETSTGQSRTLKRIPVSEMSVQYLSCDDVVKPIKDEVLMIYLDAYIGVRRPQHRGWVGWCAAHPEDYAMNLVELQKTVVMWLVARTGLFPLLKMVAPIEDMTDFVFNMNQNEQNEFEDIAEDGRFALVKQIKDAAAVIRNTLQVKIVDQFKGKNMDEWDCGGVEEIMGQVVLNFIAECERIANQVKAFKSVVALRDEGMYDATIMEKDEDDLCSEILGMHSNEIADWLLGVEQPRNEVEVGIVSPLANRAG